MITSPWQRMVEALEDPDWEPTPDQVAYLMATAARWAREAIEGEPSPGTYQAGYLAGYQARVAEENAAYPPPVIFSHQGALTAWNQAEYRRECDRQARQPRPGDHTGGPVAVW